MARLTVWVALASLAAAVPQPPAVHHPMLPPLGEWEIAVAANASAPEAYAAQQLAHFLNLPLVRVANEDLSAAPGRPRFEIGATLAKQADVALHELTTPEAFACASSVAGGAFARMVLTGGEGQPRGALNAVFELLRELGFRWWAPATQAGKNVTGRRSTLPPTTTLHAAPPPVCNRRYDPPFEHRCYNPYLIHEGEDAWRLVNHLTGAMDAELPALPPEQGGGIGYVDGYFVSTFYQLVRKNLCASFLHASLIVCKNADVDHSQVPPEDHFAEHPEWYSYGCIHGNCTRRHSWKPNGPPALARKGLGSGCDAAQLCLSNPELRKFVANRTLAAYAAMNDTNDGQHGTPPSIISVSQMDCSAGSRCQCAKCLALEKEYGGTAGPYVMLGNEVAAAVAADGRFPNVSIDNLAYTFTEDAPSNISVGPGLITRWAPIDIDFAYPLSEQKHPGTYSSQTPDKQLAGWQEAAANGGGKVYSWVYYDNFADFLMPHPNWLVIGADIEFLASHGVRGVFAEATESYPTADMDELRAWVMAQKTFDPSRNSTALVHEFLTGFYGDSAAPLVWTYLTTFSQAARATGGVTKYGLPTAAWVTIDAILDSAAALRQAVAEAPEEFRPQLDRLWLTPRYLVRYLVHICSLL